MLLGDNAVWFEAPASASSQVRVWTLPFLVFLYLHAVLSNGCISSIFLEAGGQDMVQAMKTEIPMEGSGGMVTP